MKPNKCDCMRTFMHGLMTDEIQGVIPGLIKFFLWILSLVYGVAVRFVLFLHGIKVFRQHSVNKPVICVGNITMGGVGKTPLVEAIVKFLKQNNIRPAVLIRGYMLKKSSSTDEQQWLSDEAQLLKESLKDVPILIGSDRVKNAQEALKKQDIDVFVCDDGFQHWRLKRDLDIVAINAINPFGNECLIPRGILREPLSSLTRADMFVITKSTFGKKNVERIKSRLKGVNENSPVFEADHKAISLIDCRDQKSELEVVAIKNRQLVALSSIGDPKSFKCSLEQLGSIIEKTFAFSDHYCYEKKDVEMINSLCLEQEVKTVVTTQKDAVKLKELMPFFSKKIAVYSLKIEIGIEQGEREFFSRILSVLGR